MKKYLLQSKKTGANILFGYRDGVLVYIEAKENVSKLQVLWLHNELPINYEGFQAFKKKVEQTGSKISEVKPDLSFEAFWIAYAFKKGTKKNVQRTWNSMDETEQIKALAYIKKYNFFLAENSHVQRLYPQTFLNRAEWNN